MKRMLLSAVLAMAAPVFAQENGASVTVAPLTVDRLVIGSRYVIDQKFAAKYTIKVPVDFAFTAPRRENQKIYAKAAPGGDGIIKLFYTDQEDKVQSHIQFVPFTIDRVSVEQRIAGLQELVKKAFLSSVKDEDSARVNRFQRIDEGKYPALDMIGHYKDPQDGLIVRRIVAIPDPDSENGLLVIINALINNLPLKKPEDILTTSASRTLWAFEFQH